MLDSTIIAQVQQKQKLARGDAKCMIFISDNEFGMGILLVTIKELNAVTWELEICLNGQDC